MQFASSTEAYVALIADIKESRRWPDQDQMGEELKQTARRLNEQFGEDLALPAVQVGGDGIKALFHTASRALQAVSLITDHLAPRRVVFGVGRGRLTRPLENLTMEEANGPCFHRAAEALERSKKRGWVGFRGFGAPLDRLLTAQYSLLADLRDGWTDRQRQIVRLLQRMETQKAVAEHLGVSPSVVSESLQAAGYKRIRDMEKAIQVYLDEVLDAAWTAAVESFEAARAPRPFSAQRLADGDGPEQTRRRARALLAEAGRLHEQGRWDGALELAEKAVDLLERLAKEDAEAYAPDLALALNNLGSFYSRVGRHDDAMGPAQEAVKIRRGLVERFGDRFLPDLAMSLNNLGNRYSGVGRYDDAVAPAEEAVMIGRDLVGRFGDRYLPDLAMSLNNLGALYSEVGRHDDAVAPAQEAVEAYRNLVERFGDRYLHKLATSLNNLGALYSGAGRRKDAVAPAEEAVRIHRDRVERFGDRFLPDLAMSLNNLGNQYSGAGRHDDAVAPAEEAVEIRRDLVERFGDRYLYKLAMSLNNLGNQYSGVGRHGEAVAPAKEAVEAYRHLVERFGDRFLPDLATSLYTRGRVQRAGGEGRAAAATFLQAARTVLPALPNNPSALLPLARNLVSDYLSSCKEEGMEPDEEALAPVRDAIAKAEKQASEPETPRRSGKRPEATPAVKR